MNFRKSMEDVPWNIRQPPQNRGAPAEEGGGIKKWRVSENGRGFIV